MSLDIHFPSFLGLTLGLLLLCLTLPIAAQLSHMLDTNINAAVHKWSDEKADRFELVGMVIVNLLFLALAVAGVADGLWFITPTLLKS